eukprot:GHVQ01026256.1.p1 GENE.GHVQ01026256.1~~GHVQ01026256.1.p1  ORF type:complete len:1067 (-),score=151.18 GHVQ01026256.1:2333-5533(-)
MKSLPNSSSPSEDNNQNTACGGEDVNMQEKYAGHIAETPEHTTDLVSATETCAVSPAADPLPDPVIEPFSIGALVRRLSSWVTPAPAANNPSEEGHLVGTLDESSIPKTLTTDASTAIPLHEQDFSTTDATHATIHVTSWPSPCKQNQEQFPLSLPDRPPFVSHVATGTTTDQTCPSREPPPPSSMPLQLLDQQSLDFALTHFCNSREGSMQRDRPKLAGPSLSSTALHQVHVCNPSGDSEVSSPLEEKPSAHIIRLSSIVEDDLACSDSDVKEANRYDEAAASQISSQLQYQYNDTSYMRFVTVPKWSTSSLFRMLGPTSVFLKTKKSVDQPEVAAESSRSGLSDSRCEQEQKKKGSCCIGLLKHILWDYAQWWVIGSMLTSFGLSWVVAAMVAHSSMSTGDSVWAAILMVVLILPWYFVAVAVSPVGLQLMQRSLSSRKQRQGDKFSSRVGSHRPPRLQSGDHQTSEAQLPDTSVPSRVMEEVSIDRSDGQDNERSPWLPEATNAPDRLEAREARRGMAEAPAVGAEPAFADHRLAAHSSIASQPGRHVDFRLGTPSHCGREPILLPENNQLRSIPFPHNMARSAMSSTGHSARSVASSRRSARSASSFVVGVYGDSKETTMTVLRHNRGAHTASLDRHTAGGWRTDSGRIASAERVVRLGDLASVRGQGSLVSPGSSMGGRGGEGWDSVSVTSRLSMSGSMRRKGRRRARDARSELMDVLSKQDTVQSTPGKRIVPRYVEALYYCLVPFIFATLDMVMLPYSFKNSSRFKAYCGIRVIIHAVVGVPISFLLQLYAFIVFIVQSVGGNSTTNMAPHKDVIPIVILAVSLFLNLIFPWLMFFYLRGLQWIIGVEKLTDALYTLMDLLNCRLPRVVQDRALDSRRFFRTQSCLLDNLDRKNCKLLLMPLHYNTDIEHVDIMYPDFGAMGPPVMFIGDQQATQLSQLIIVSSHIVSFNGVAIRELADDVAYSFQLHNKLTGDPNLIAVLCEMFSTSTVLRSVDLRNNKISEFGASWIARALARNSSILHLNLAGTNLGDKGMVLIAKGLSRNSTVKIVSLKGDGLFT